MVRTWMTLLTLLLTFQAHSHGHNILSPWQSLWDGRWQQEVNGHYTLELKKDGSPSFIEHKLETPQSFVRKRLQMSVRVNDMSLYGGIEIRLSTDDEYNNYFAIEMPYFTDPEFNLLQSGDWQDVSFTSSHVRRRVGNPDINNIKKIGFYIAGSPNDQSLVIELRNIQWRTIELSGVVSITMDDGHDEQFIAANIMAERSLRGTAYVMVNDLNASSEPETDDPYDTNTTFYMSYEQVVILNQGFHWGLSSHHYTPLTEMTKEQLNQEIDNTITILEELGAGEDALHLAYPLGKHNRSLIDSVIKSSFLTARIASGGVETLPPADWYKIRTVNVTPDLDATKLSQIIRSAVDNGDWVVLMFHKFIPKGESVDELTYSLEEFTKLCDWLKNNNIPVHPVHEVYEAFHD